MKFVKGLLSVAGKLSQWSAAAVQLFVLVLTLELVYDMIARYVFNAPTIWSFDLSYMLAGALFMIGLAYTLAMDEHVRVAILHEKWSPRGQAIADIVSYLIFFFPSFIIIFWLGIQETIYSFQVGEVTALTPLPWPMGPFKAVIPVSALLLLIQGTAEFARCVAVGIFNASPDGPHENVLYAHET